MKIKLSILIAIFTISMLSTDTHAVGTDSTFIRYGMTDDGITYQVLGNTLAATEDTITVTRTIIFDGQVTPALSQSWTEYINGIKYSGSLYLVFSVYNAETNETKATYEGVLVAQS